MLAALPRSLHHLRLLVDNGAAPDLVLYRDEAMAAPIAAAYPGRARFLGREAVPGRSPAAVIAARRANRAYYPAVRQLVERAGIDRLILFLEGEPLERFLLALPSIRDVELWEDGLSHYVDLTSPLWYGARGALQAALGFHPRGILRRRIDRSRVTVRDRFEHGGLRLAPPPAPSVHRRELLLVGSPLVEDRLVPRARFVGALATIAAASPLPVRYLPHPRESLDRLGADVAAAKLTLEPNPAGLMRHAGRFGYTAYAAAVSTGLLDLDRAERSVFVPGLFGLGRMARVLAGWPANPVPLAGTPAELSALLARLARET